MVIGDWDYLQFQSLIAKLECKISNTKSFGKIKELTVVVIINNTPHFERETEKIKCVVTVLAIWDEHQKNIMMESCIGAGLVNENIDQSLFFKL